MDELSHGILRFHSFFPWETNAALLAMDGHVVVCDPAFTPDEIEVIGREASSRAVGGPIDFLLTHHHYDHTCGISYFPDARVIAGQRTAELIADGTAARELEQGFRDWKVRWPDELRVDEVVDAESTFSCGPFTIDALATPGHTVDGLGFFVRELGVLLPGDYLKVNGYPVIEHSVSDTIDTHRRLIDVLMREEVRWVIPGHGPVAGGSVALQVAQEDLEYLFRLRDAAYGAVSRAQGVEHALLTTFEVPPPREITSHFAATSPRVANARMALAEAEQKPHGPTH